MRERKLYEKKRAKKGSGRAKTIPVQVSAELHGELSMIKDAYSKCLGRPVTFEQMLRRWIDRLSRIDSDVNDEYQVIRKTRLETEAGAAITAKEAVSGIFKRMQGNGTSAFAEALKEQEAAEAALEEDRRASTGDSPAPAEDQVQSPESVATPEVPADPTEGEVWLKGYYFERNGVRIDALVGTKGAAFYCKFNDRDTGIGPMLYDHHFRFYNSDGTELSKEQAEKISSRIKDHDQFEADH